MNRYFEYLINNKYKVILFSQAFLLIIAILVIGLLNEPEQKNSEMQIVGSLTAMGYLSLIVYPFLWIQGKVLSYIRKDRKRVPSAKKIYEIIFGFLISLSQIGGLAFIITSVFDFEFFPIYFVSLGVSFVFALISDKLLVR
ncbi:hypothetical protein [Salinispira pacifica]|uniref:hypothetical protein n=1 Tax=Salinispira pacifica TaxID=1307761 RepID=UPI00059BC7D5|nr:hypothetical protein [Salinispira pacifica]